MRPYPKPPQWESSPRRRSVRVTCIAPPCIGLRTQTLSRCREKAPINPAFSFSAQRETAGQAPVPYARDAPTRGSMVAGGSSDDATFGPKDPKVLLAGPPCVRSCVRTALLND